MCSSTTTAGRGSERRPTVTSRASAISGSRPETKRPAAALAQFSAHEQRHLFARSSVDGRDYARAPIRTRLFVGGDSLLDGLTDALRDVELEPGDVVAVSEKAVAICQGRSYPVDEVRARPLARTLSRFVGRTASGIGLGIPATMELAIREAGEARILTATAAAAVTKPFGVKGVFYRVAGPAVRAIDGPTRGTIPPYDGHAKLGPGRSRRRRPGGGAGAGCRRRRHRRQRHRRERPRRVERRRPRVVESLLRDNPLGQGAQQTPVALLRPV